MLHISYVLFFKNEVHLTKIIELDNIFRCRWTSETQTVNVKRKWVISKVLLTYYLYIIKTYLDN